jgi:predicted ATPase
MAWPVPWLSRVRVTNYRSIADCDVTLGPLTLLVGPNGTGKSNADRGALGGVRPALAGSHRTLPG